MAHRLEPSEMSIWKTLRSVFAILVVSLGVSLVIGFSAVFSDESAKSKVEYISIIMLIVVPAVYSTRKWPKRDKLTPGIVFYSLCTWSAMAHTHFGQT